MTIPAGSASVGLTIVPLEDNSYELPEGVLLTSSANAAYSVGTAHAVGITIADNDALVSVTASDRDASEEGSNPGSVTVSRLGPTITDLVVFYAMSGTATNGADYAALSGSVTIAAGSATAAVIIVPGTATVTISDQ